MYWLSAKSSRSSASRIDRAIIGASSSMASIRSSSRSSEQSMTSPISTLGSSQKSSCSVAAGSRSVLWGRIDAGCKSAVPVFNAAMCSAVVPQQPPKIRTPASAISRRWAVNCLGGQLYTVASPRISGIPALGFAIRGTRACSYRRRSWVTISPGPTEQFSPNASISIPCMICRTATTSDPLSVRPFASHVKVTKIGFRLTLRTARTAARASARVIIVSITNRSTPAFSRAAACSV